MEESGRAFLFLRTCFFCNREEVYQDWPDDTVISNGILACADCLKIERIARVMELARSADRVDFMTEVLGG